ncbi:MAG: hypothetical protein ACUVWX_09310 [Kiritimatiellia bacterium]
MTTMLPSFSESGAAEGSFSAPLTNAIKSISVRRCNANPLIQFKSSASLGDNINGPSVIRVPSWIGKPLGKYYMYFANHQGKYIRLAYSDTLKGPWRIHEPGTLNLSQAKGFSGHIASPDVHVDDQQQEIRMYFHGLTKGEQKTGVAISRDGLTFATSGATLGEFYFRVFQWQDAYYAIAKAGNSGWGSLNRSPDGLSPFQKRGNFLRNMRHAAVMIIGNQLLVFYSRVHDAPERIVVATVTLTSDWKDWKESEPIDVIQPEADYEGISYPNKPSTHGAATNVRQLRDPCIFQEEGRTYLFYSIAGEMGIAMAELEITMMSNAEEKSEREDVKPAR